MCVCVCVVCVCACVCVCVRARVCVAYLRVGNGAIEVVELLLEEETRDRGLEELSNSCSRRVCAVGCAEGVVDVPVFHYFVKVLC